MTRTRPKLGELVKDQPVMVRRSANDMRRRKPEDRWIPARVIKVARVWVDLEGTEKRTQWSALPTWRMRRDTQDEGSRYPGSNASFATMDQHAWYVARDQAVHTLRYHGIDLHSNSPWRGREVELAGLISQAVRDAETQAYAERGRRAAQVELLAR